MGETRENSSAKVKTSGKDLALRILKRIWSDYSLVVILVVIFIIVGNIVPRFLYLSNQLLILRHAAIIGMIALGATFIIIAGGVDLSAGHVMAASGTVLIMLQGNENIPLVVAILACFAVAITVGLLNGFVVTKTGIAPFIVTLAIGIMVRSIALNAVGGVSITGRRIPAFTNIGNGTIGVIPIPLIIWVSFAIIFGCILAYTKFGSYIYAVGGNENAARYSGIPVKKVRIACFAIGGFCVAVAALLSVSRMAAIATSTSGYLYEFDAITAALVGGTALSGGRGKIVGTFFGMIAISVVSNLMIMLQISPYLGGFVKGAIILLAVLMQSRKK